jgi:hypothetical protein
MTDDAPFRALVANPGGTFSRTIWRILADLGVAGADTVRRWVAERAQWLPNAMVGVQIAATDAQGYATGDDALSYAELCAIRSGLENLRFGFLMADLGDPELDLDAWDDFLASLAASPLSGSPVQPPPSIPADHWWWGAQTHGRPASKDYDPWDPDTY